MVKCLRRSAVSTLSLAMGFSPLNVVRLLNSASGISSNSLAIHSSANELLTTFTPVKSSTTQLFCSISGSNCSRTRLPNGRVPKFSPYSLKLNVTIIPPIRYQLGMCHYIDLLHLCGLLQPPQGQFLYLYAVADILSYPAKSRSR